MPVQKVLEKWSIPVNEVTIGATREQGGTRSRSVKIGGEDCLPFMSDEGKIPNPPVIAMEVTDMKPENWPAPLEAIYKDVWNDPVKWAQKCEKEFGADIILLKLSSCHPDNKNTSPADAAAVVKAIKQNVSLPLIVWGSEVPEKDNLVMPEVSQVLKGEKALLGIAEQDNYKTLTGTCIADGHNILTMAPLDVNIGKQVNILVTDMGMSAENIVQWQTTGALGYGFEYCYSAQERIRLAGLGGDKLLAIPLLATCGWESWKAKEAKSPEAEFPHWGPAKERGIAWEFSTATGMLLSGANIVSLLHPESVKLVRRFINTMLAK